MPLAELVVFGRHDCSLCDDMIKHLISLQYDDDKKLFNISIIDIDNDNTQKIHDLNDKIPVLYLDNEEICRCFLDEKALRDTLLINYNTHI